MGGNIKTDLEQQGVRLWSGCIWLSIVTVAEFVNKVMSVRLP